LVTTVFKTQHRCGAVVFQFEPPVEKLTVDQVQLIQAIGQWIGSDWRRRFREERRLKLKARDDQHFDKLTGLLNHAGLRSYLSHDAAQNRRGEDDKTYTLLLVNFDRFKLVNTDLGRDAGDELLGVIGEKIEKLVRVDDIPARLAGDEFAVILNGTRRFEDTLTIAERLVQAFNDPIAVAGQEVRITASIGIVPGAEQYEKPDELLRDAEIALQHAKASGRARYKIFDPAMGERCFKKLVLERELRNALDKDQLFLVYQPIVCVEDGRVSGFEALVRWRHPELGLIQPDHFISVAEESGLIVPVGAWIFEEACRQLKIFDRCSHELELTMNINLSRRQLVQPDIVEQIERVIRKSGIEPSRIKLEITESVIMDESVDLTPVLEELRGIGCLMAMDDFGKGASSLSCLHKFPIDVLKIDRSFLLNLEERVEFAAVIQAIVTLAHALGIRVVAEGIETPEQLATLQALECDLLQGYLFAKPLEAADAIAFLNRPIGMQLRSA
jgi:diguanylate cyclase (GGDEF)-like protein